MAAIGGRYPTVIKADGLAAGKGVIIAGSQSEAAEALQALLVERRFGTEQVVVEEFLAGEELSLLAVCDGETALPLASAQDYKRIFDGDLGPNTGGMGSYSPVPAVDAAAAAAICRSVAPTCLGRTPPAGHRLPRRALRRPDDDRRRAEGARVQRSLRGSRDAGDPAAAPDGSAGQLLDAAVVPGGLAGVSLDWAPDWCGHRRVGEPGGTRRARPPAT